MEYLYFRLYEKAGIHFYIQEKKEREQNLLDFIRLALSTKNNPSKLEAHTLTMFHELLLEFQSQGIDNLRANKFALRTFQCQTNIEKLIQAKLNMLPSLDVDNDDFQSLLNSNLPKYYFLIFRLKELRAKFNEDLLERNDI